MSTDTITIGGLSAIIIAMLAFFIKREFSRLDTLSNKVGAVADTLTSIKNDVGNVLLMQGTLAAIERSYHKFFDQGGERETLWKKIDELKAELEKSEQVLRERTHWLANRLTSIQGRMEINGIKLADMNKEFPSWD